MPSPPPRRAWGTRYDSLVETPSTGTTVVPGYHHPSNASMASNNVISSTIVESRDPDATHGPAEKERSNADHDYLHSQGAIDAASPIQARMPHDASVFVASLPSQVPEAELQILLSEHLSQHANIKHIKLIRDNRGTVCAFVQVESPSQAADLIAACALSPFMDRYIRCEKARAFRTLLVSWRPAPTSAQASNELQSTPQGDNPFRLRRCRGTKYIQVTHGSEALPADPAQLPNYTPPRPDDPLSGSGILFLEGIKDGDMTSLKLLLEAFGPLEFITPFETNIQPPAQRAMPFSSEPQSTDENAFMRGGSAATCVKESDNENPEQARPRRPMWAVKWEHRNDAVSAITALQYVPSLFVCWSHTFGRPHQPPYSQYGPHGHSRTSSVFGTRPSQPSTPFRPNDTNIATHPQDAEKGPASQWAVVSMAAGGHSQVQGPTIAQPEQQNMITFSESDFPPLSGEGSSMVVGRGRGKKGVWLGRRSFVRAGAPSPPPISTTLDASGVSTEGPDTLMSAVPHTPDLESVVEPSPVTPGFPVTPRTPSGGYAPAADDVRKDPVYVPAQGYTVPFGAVPGYMTTIAPRPGYIVPQTFAAPYVTPHAFPMRHPFEETQTKAPDGRELFIGGLDMEMWDEERVRSVFGQYGTIEEMRFVKPGIHAPVHRRAFAFVKFTDYEASQKAIKEEHLRVYDDRKIKVQMRDANPPKRWGYRGRGRFNQGLLRIDRGVGEFDHDSSTGDIQNSVEGESEPDENGHVRFTSAPEAERVQEEGVNNVQQESASEKGMREMENGADPNSLSEPTESNVGDHAEGSLSDMQTKHETASAGSSCSDGAPNASMEVQNHSADTTLTFADVTVTQTTLAEPTSQAQELQSDPDSQTVTSTPPPSNPDASSTYAASSAGSAPTSNGYYAQTPSWIPPYVMPPAPYGPYGYYPQQVAGQPAADGSNPYPWMAALYRNVVPFVPWFNPPPGVELAAPPVRPTGYIQREPGGIFIPVYPPERLGQYMSTTGTSLDQSQGQSQSNASTIGHWQNLPPHPQLYPVPFPIQQTMMMPPQVAVGGQQSQHQHQPQVPLAGNGWIAAPPPGTAYPTIPPSSAPPPYPAPNSYYPSQTTSVSARAGGMYGQYDAIMHPTPVKNSNRRGHADYGHQQHRMSGGVGSREGRGGHQRRGHGGSGMNGVEPTYPVGIDAQWQVKQSALPAQLAGTSGNPSGNTISWN